jgi:protein-tyrosine phosphatase
MDFESLKADFVNHPITGWLHTGERLNVPLISHIIDNLYVGGCIQGTNLHDFFSDIISLYPWERYAFDEDATNLYEFKMYDSHDGLDLDTIEQAANTAYMALAMGGNVLIHCQAGINRSNLVAATVLKKLGYTGERAIALLSEKRSPLILANQTFRNHILGD